MVIIAIVLLVILAGVIGILMGSESSQKKMGETIPKIHSAKKLRTLRMPTLYRYSKDLTLLASRGELDPVVGRDKEIKRVIQILSRRTKNNPILIGEAGVGKTAIAEGLAQTLLSNIWEDNLSSKRVLSLDLSSLLAGTKFRGEFEKRLKAVSDEIVASERQIILFIDEIHTLANAGEATGGIGAADTLKPSLARGELQVVGATTPLEFQTHIKNDATLARRFQPVLVKEPTIAGAIMILEALKPRYSNYHGVEITGDAIKKAVTLSAKKIKGRRLPDKAIDVIDEAASLAKLNAVLSPPSGGGKPKVTPKDIESVIADWAASEI